jgi:peptidoglycan hydrolase-like protein with peptidoglycan-binding domain
MIRSALPLAVLGLMMTAVPALAQGLPAGQPLQQSDLEPVRDVLVATQQRLQQMGYTGEVTGHFNAQTRNNIIAYQADHGLRPTGNIDLETLASMGIDVNTGQATAMMGREPGQQYAMADEPVQRTRQYAMLDQTTAARRGNELGESRFINPRIPLLNYSEFTSSPQLSGQGYPLAPMTGIGQPDAYWNAGQVGALPAGTFIDTVRGGVWN